MTNPTHSAFPVTVKFRGISYDVEITPTMNGKPIEWLQGRVDQWNGAEKTHKLFSQTIQDMLDSSDIPDDYLTTKGSLTLGSAEHFTFNDKTVVAHNDDVKEVWETFIDFLQDPVSHIAGKDPVKSDDEEVSAVGPGAVLRISPSVYSNLGPEQQKAVRLSLFKKKCEEHFAKVNDLRSAEDLYNDDEKSCLESVLYRNPTRPKMPPGKEAHTIWLAQSKQEREEMAPHVKRIREEQEALKAKQAAESSSDEDVFSKMSDEEEDLYL